jgi:hypothetical protein
MVFLVLHFLDESNHVQMIERQVQIGLFPKGFAGIAGLFFVEDFEGIELFIFGRLSLENMRSSAPAESPQD